MTLAKKLNHVVLLLFLIASVLYAGLIFYFHQQRMQMTADKIAVFIESIAANNTKALANELFENRPRAIGLRLDSIVNVEGIASCVALNRDYRMIVHKGEAVTIPAFDDNSLPTTPRHWIEGSNLLFITPLNSYEETFGYLLLQYPLKDLRKEASKTLFFFAFSTLTFLFLTLILVNRFTRRSIVAPLSNLIQVMTETKTGKAAKQLEVRGCDEIQNLSQTYNSMNEQLNRSYEKVESTRAFVEQIINTIDSILVSIDTDSRVSAWNTAATQYTKVLKQDAIGKDVFAIMPQLQEFREQINNTLFAKTDDFFHRQLIKGVYYNLHIYSLSGRGASGALIRLDDITQLEEKENQLRQSQKMETVGQLAGGIAHDFNNMLAGIMGATELLKLESHTSKTASYIDIIMNSGQRAADLVAKLLVFSRKNNQKSEAVDIHEAIKAAISLLQRSINKNINIKTSFLATDSIIDGDLTELQNSFLNLGINASHAMVEGGDLLFSTCLFVRKDIPGKVLPLEPDTENSFIEVQVCDTGEGIEENYLDSIFEPFFTTKVQGKGTGLGLAAVYGTVQQHQGTISVESTLGKGTTFHLCFPLSHRKLEKEDNNPASDAIKGDGCVLVIDDEPLVRVVAKGMLESLGYTVLLAENGREGTDLFRQKHQSIDLVLLDMIMPEMSGPDCFNKLIKIDSEVRVILSSGYVPGEALKKLKNCGLAGYINKPYQLSLLGSVVRKALKYKHVIQ